MSSSLPVDLQSTLSNVQRQLRGNDFMAGFGKTAVLVAGLLLTFLAADWLITLGPGVRTTLLIVFAAASLFGGIAWIAFPLLRRNSPEELAGWSMPRGRTSTSG